MNKQIAERWIKALRSGKYKKGTKVLHNAKNNTFCCLGVLCELAVKSGVISKPEKGSSIYSGNRLSLPKKVLDWAEMKDDEGQLPFGKYKNVRLSGINDKGKVGFNRIADIIERNIKEL